MRRLIILKAWLTFYKVSSSDLSNFFIRHIAKKGKPVYMSVGAAYISEVDEAVRILVEEGCEDIVLFHCVLSYPTDPKDANLEIISTLKRYSLKFVLDLVIMLHLMIP